MTRGFAETYDSLPYYDAFRDEFKELDPGEKKFYTMGFAARARGSPVSPPSISDFDFVSPEQDLDVLEELPEGVEWTQLRSEASEIQRPAWRAMGGYVGTNMPTPGNAVYLAEPTDTWVVRWTTDRELKNYSAPVYFEPREF